MTKHSAEVKAAVITALLAGQSISSVAKEYNIPKGTVKSWKHRQNADPVATVATPKKEIIGNLLVKYLATNLEALDAQAEFTKNEKWLQKQTASDLAVLHGVMTDKSIRLLEAMSNAAEPENTDS